MNLITNWQNSDFFSDLRDKTNLVIDLMDDETIDNIARRLTSDVVRQLVDYTTGSDQVVILWGVELTGTNPGARTWTEGAIYYEGDIYIIDAGSDTTTGSEVLVFDDITASGVHEIKEVTLVNGTVSAGIGQDVEGSNVTRYIRWQDLNLINTVSSNAIACKVLDIGTWDMDTNSTKSVAHGLSDILKIVSVSTIIVNDAEDTVYNLEKSFSGSNLHGWIQGITSTNIVLERAAGVGFDDSNFNDGTINRGKITILYEA